MSSQILVSLCVIRIEIEDQDSQKSPGAMAARKMRGCREPKDVKVESYASIVEGPSPLLSSRGPGKSNSSSRANSEEAHNSATPVSGPAEGDGAVARTSPDQINFISGNPFVEVTKGILHLFKEDELTEMHQAAERSHTICILSVPATMTCHDLLTFTAACHQDIQHFRIIRDGSPNQYMALLTFRSAVAASEFYETFNGAPYNSLEPEIVCHMVFVSRVEVGDGGLPLAGHTELPSCPVCLERMDESVDGILTILCNHAFHSSCLVKWGDTSCPVCRYAQTPEPLADSHCMECGACSDALWICLICGHVGCSRYHQGHAFEHYRDTHHCYAMQLGNNRVWDYVGDNFVHRLLQDKDGKMVEGSREGAKSEGAAVDEKVDSVQLEFTYLLTSQLESQRQFFEEKLGRLEQRTVSENSELREKLGQMSDENVKFKEQLSLAIKEKQSLEKRLHHSSTKLTQALSELSEEKQLSKALQTNLSSWQTKHKQLQLEFNQYKGAQELEMTDLREQLRDVMFFFEAQKQIENSADKEEIASGRIIIGQTSSAPTPAANTRTTRRQQKKH
ncbi:BRCA1-associated protein isoform X1 [Neodiprion pinetum]|uniref:BRCA1-associated protein isoform X1 n=2 Tax=Neodiprion lecontei TaxID=441921 RepID=A0A6J0BXF5_NEOLC|nr:BRCA1-associated protein isoform X1 [Neodiprion lecontei]XP_046465557.1 BRCA1-associated protein isoform X1 [Neodiprion pinetum]